VAKQLFSKFSSLSEVEYFNPFTDGSRSKQQRKKQSSMTHIQLHFYQTMLIFSCIYKAGDQDQLNRFDTTLRITLSCVTVTRVSFLNGQNSE
jgi:hypothetical protein